MSLSLTAQNCEFKENTILDYWFLHGSWKIKFVSSKSSVCKHSLARLQYVLARLGSEIIWYHAITTFWFTKLPLLIDYSTWHRNVEPEWSDVEFNNSSKWMLTLNSLPWVHLSKKPQVGLAASTPLPANSDRLCLCHCSIIGWTTTTTTHKDGNLCWCQSCPPTRMRSETTRASGQWSVRSRKESIFGTSTGASILFWSWSVSDRFHGSSWAFVFRMPHHWSTRYKLVPFGQRWWQHWQ